MSANASQRLPEWLEIWFKVFFVSAHFVVPFVGLRLFTIVYGTDTQFTWQHAAIIAAVLLPFILPLIAVYVSKAGPFEMRSVSPPPNSAHIEPNVVAVIPAAPSVPANAIVPNFAALTQDEVRVLKTLWTFQQRHEAGGGVGRWCFKIPPESPTYQSFQSGCNDLYQRRLVVREAGMVLLTDMGVEYCRNNNAALAGAPLYWSSFQPN